MKEKIKEKFKNSSVFRGGVIVFCVVMIFGTGYLVGSLANININIPWLQQVVKIEETTTTETTTAATTTETATVPTTTTTEAPETTTEPTTEIDSICDFVRSMIDSFSA